MALAMGDVDPSTYHRSNLSIHLQAINCLGLTCQSNASLLLKYKALNGLAPPYLKELIEPYQPL